MSPVYMDPNSELEAKLNKIEDHLELHDPKLTNYQENGWKLITKLIKEYCIYLIPDIYMQFLIKLSIKLAGIYYTQVRLRDNYFRKRKQLKNCRSTIVLFQMIITTVLTRDRKVGLDIIIEAIDRDHLWDYEQFCLKTIEIYVHSSKKYYEVLFEILEIVYTYMNDSEMFPKTKALLNVFSELLTRDRDWYKHEEDLGLKILNLHIKSIENPVDIRYGLELVIRKFLMLSSNDMLLTVIENILEYYSGSDLEELDLKKLEYSIKIATNWYVTEECLWTSFKYDTLKDMLTLIASPVKAKCVFGNETFQNIMDTQKNLYHFKSPKIFFNEINYNLNISRLNSENKEFIKRYRKELHLTFLTAIKNHKDDLQIIGLIYISIALIIIAIPSDFSAAMVVCLIMNVQKNTLAENQIACAESHRIHAVVISIMSLVCWVTESIGLYSYLNEILTLRAYNAPFLNPPLKVDYTYATHYVLWNKPEFFFEIFEVRYALWKRFRLDEKNIYRPVFYNNARRSYRFRGSKSTLLSRTSRLEHH